jgi:uncharacterized protein YhaN
MRLTDLNINGFGVFHNLRIEGLSPGLTVFLGLNESGKSTLLGFVRAIFYGFPDGRSAENPYLPLSGGQHGGNITFVTDDRQRWTIVRSPGPRGGRVEVHGLNQITGRKDVLDRFVGATNRTLFRNIFAFSLSELQDFTTLHTESVAEALYSAGAGIDPGGLARLKSSLEKKEGELFKPGGAKPQINTLLSRLSDIQREKHELLSSLEQYDTLRTQVSSLSRELKALEEERVGLTLRLKRQEHLLNAWPDWVNRSLTIQRLSELEWIEHFPHEGVTRLESFKARLGDAQKELEEKKENLKRRESELSLLKTDPMILKYGPSIKALQRDQGHFEAVGKELTSLGREIADAEERVREGLKRLGPSWDEGKLLQFDLSIAIREEVRHYREEAGEAESAAARRKDSLDQIASGRRLAEGVLGSLPEPSVKDPQRLKQMKSSSQRLKGLQSRHHSVTNELRYVSEHMDELKAEKKILDEPLVEEEPRSILLPISIAVAMALLFLVWLGSSKGWALAVAVGGLFLLFAFAWWHLKRGMAAKGEARAQGFVLRRDHLDGKIKGLETRRTDLEKEREGLGGEMSALCRDLGLSGMPSEDAVERMDQDLSTEMRHLDRWLEANQQTVQAKRTEEQAMQEMEKAQSELNRTRRQWQEWLEGRGLDPVLTADGALETFSLIESCKEQARHLGQLRERRTSLDETIKRYSTLLGSVLESCQRQPAAKADVLVAVNTLIQEFERAEQAAQKETMLQNEIRGGSESIERLKNKTLGLQEGIRELLAAGATDQEERFRERALAYEKRVALNGDLERYEASIKRLSSILGQGKSVADALSGMSFEELEGQRLRLEKELQEIEEKLDHLKKEQARIEEQSRQLMNDERLSALRGEEEGIKETLSVLAEEWCVLRLSQRLVRMARLRYEKDMQPEVIREAGRFFNQLTLGRYPSIVAPIGENRIQVVCNDNSRKETIHLSRGTAEQLYLSLRFGFIREFSRRSESPPIVMDEILVNFDPARARATARAILDLSREHQVLFFTCHPETVRFFREVDPGVPALEISAGEVRRISNIE